jgi:hypothetical protein
MVRVRVMQKCFYDNRLLEAGAELDIEDSKVTIDNVVFEDVDNPQPAPGQRPPTDRERARPKGKTAPPPGSTAAFMGHDAIDPKA